MGHEGVAEAVLVHVTVGVGRFGRAQQRQRQRAAVHVPAVLGVVEDGRAPLRLGQVGPLVAAHFKLGPVPARVAVRRTRHVSELGVEGRLTVSTTVFLEYFSRQDDFYCGIRDTLFVEKKSAQLGRVIDTWWLWTLTGNSTLRNLRFSAQSTVVSNSM